MVPLLVLVIAGLAFVAVLVALGRGLLRRLGRWNAPPAQRAAGAVIGFAGLGCLGLFGSGILLLGTAFVGATIALEHGPIRAIEVVRMHPPLGNAGTVQELTRAGLFPEDRRYPVRVTVELDRPANAERIGRWVERESHGKVRLVDYRNEGAGRHVLDFGLRIRPEELEDELPFELPRSLRVVVRDP